MFKLDNDFLQSLGLGGLPVDEKNRLLQMIYERLEMNVGMRLAEKMTDQQLDEFEGFIDRNDEAGALKWLETNFPNYKDVVAEELEKLKVEVQTAAPQILAAHNGVPGQPVPAIAQEPQMPGVDQPQEIPGGQQQPQYGPTQPMQQQYQQPAQPSYQSATQPPDYGQPQASSFGHPQPMPSPVQPQYNSAQPMSQPTPFSAPAQPQTNDTFSQQPVVQPAQSAPDYSQTAQPQPSYSQPQPVSPQPNYQSQPPIEPVQPQTPQAPSYQAGQPQSFSQPGQSNQQQFTPPPPGFTGQ